MARRNIVIGRPVKNQRGLFMHHSVLLKKATSLGCCSAFMCCKRETVGSCSNADDFQFIFIEFNNSVTTFSRCWSLYCTL